VGYLQKASYAKYVEDKYNLSNPQNITTISVVTYAELFSFVFRRNWGDPKKQSLNELLLIFPVIYINNNDIALKFAEIHAFCQNKSPLNPPGFTSIELSHNDLWIAATASLSKSTLITTDKDFLPLDKVFLDLIHIDQTIK
jgi:tRNA(fMet)-specific endonuclease VapC